MPEDFKLALLIPLLKKVGLEVIKPNFRPLSNLPYASKMIERAVANQMVEHMKQNDLFEPLQSAYKEGHSTETVLLKVQNDLLVAMDNQRVSILVLLDLSAAFDTVNHRLLLKRLNDRCGVVGDALKWFESYLTDRSQTVKVKKYYIEENDSFLWCSSRFSIGTIVVSGLYIAIRRYYAQERATISHLC